MVILFLPAPIPEGFSARRITETHGHPQVKVLHNYVNLNVGISIQRALASATKEFVVHNAVDLPLALDDIAPLLQHMSDCDILVLERTSYAGYITWRKITSQLNRLLLKLFFPKAMRGIVDLNFTQIYRREVLAQVMPLAKSPAFTTPEMIIRAKHRGLRVKPVPVSYRPRTVGKGAFGKPHDILWSLYDMVRFRCRTL